MKSAQYWPLTVGDTETYGNLQVTTETETVGEHYIERTLTLLNCLTDQLREVKHFQSTEWPTTGVPPSGIPTIRLLQRVQAYQNSKVVMEEESIYGNSSVVEEQSRLKQLKPCVVHCSAGVGRTGVFCTLAICLNTLLDTQRVDVFTCIKHIRTQRMTLVQTPDQFAFLFTTLVTSMSLPPPDAYEEESMYGNSQIINSTAQRENSARRSAPSRPSRPMLTVPEPAEEHVDEENLTFDS